MVSKDKIKSSLADIVGAQNVSASADELESYAQDSSFTAGMKPGLVGKPASTDDLQKIVKWANETRTPLVPGSSGGPHFYGDTVPQKSGTVIVDLSRMNKIIRIDRKDRMTMIEPGVTYTQLQPELAKAGLRISTPLLPRANKSVITSLLERQPTLVPKYNWSLPEPLRCLEIVWGRGETLWTGEAGSGTHSLEKQWERGLAQVDPKGPQETDWYRLGSAAQGSMGIVTWASIKCEILPKVHQLCFVPADNLESLIDCAYRLLRVRLGDEFLLVNNLTLASILGPSHADIEKIKNKLPAWIILVASAGRDILPEERVEVQAKDIRDICSGFKLDFKSALPGIDAKQVLNTLLSPSPELYWKLKNRGAFQDLFFLTTLDKTPGFVNRVFKLAEETGVSASRIGVYIQPQHQGVSHHCEFTISYDPENKAETAAVKNLIDLACPDLIDKGAFFSRPYGNWAGPVYSKDPQAAELLGGLKKILDPNNILNPGKLCFPLQG